MIHGRDLILSDSQTGSGHFACATSCSVTTKSDFIETAHPTEGGWKRYKPTILSWSASTGHLLASYSNYKYFRSMQENKQAVTIRFYDAELQIFYKGQAFIETLDLTGDVNGLAKMKVSLQPSGPLEAAEEHTLACTENVVCPYGLTWQSAIEGEDGIFVGATERANHYIKYDEATLTAIRTRITLRPGRVLFKGDHQEVHSLLQGLVDNPTFVSKCLLHSYGATKSIVVGPGTYTVLVNDDVASDPDGYYMSSF